MTDEEKAVAIAELRFAGCHPDWIIWFSRPGDEKNLKAVRDLMIGRRQFQWITPDSYKTPPGPLGDVAMYVNSVKEQQ